VSDKERARGVNGGGGIPPVRSWGTGDAGRWAQPHGASPGPLGRSPFSRKNSFADLFLISFFFVFLLLLLF